MKKKKDVGGQLLFGGQQHLQGWTIYYNGINIESMLFFSKQDHSCLILSLNKKKT